MFSRRTGWDRQPNALAAALARRRAAGARVVDLATANPTRCGLTWPTDVLRRAFDVPGLEEHDPAPRGSEAAREVLSRWLGSRGRPAPVDSLFLTASTSEAYTALFRLLCDPGDAIALPRPSYPLLQHLADLAAVRTVTYPLRLEERWTLRVDDLAAVLPEDVRAIVVVHPNNPTASFVSEHEAVALGELAADRDVAVISDEVFADYEWRPTPVNARPLRAASAATTAAVAGALSFALGGLSKSAGLPQVKLSWIAAFGPPEVLREARERLDVILDAALSVSTPAQLALPTLLEASAAFRARVTERLRRNLEALREAARRMDGHLLPGDAGWHAVIALPDDVSAEATSLRLLDERGVLLQPGWLHDFADDRHVVVSLLPPPPDFDEGLTALATST